ncbi:MAG: T9SS type A sorting domain-containing protein [Prevotella sp.]|nr:T9SS type A sorting domain-containing protein [Prevotella sp.]MCM1074557.1 T9SS type A sorting domain-containing protein [Ruminococcus sp.]
MKKLLFTLFTGACGVFAMSGATQLQLTLADGSTPAYALAEKPNITFPGDDMVISTSEASVTYSRAEVVNMVFTEVASVDTLTGEQQFSYVCGVITAPDSEICVFNMEGMVCLQGRESLSVQDLNAGIYIVKTQNHTVKIFVK